MILFYLILLFLPTQLGRHFWPSFSFVQGIRIDYLSPTLYFTDVLIILLFIFCLTSNKFSIFNSAMQNQFSKIKKKWRSIILTAFLIIGIIFSKNSMAGVYGLAKLFEFIFLGFYIAKCIDFRKRNTLSAIVMIFSIGIIFESLLVIVQFIQQGSVGGIMYYFGERLFDGQTPGIANASLAGHLILRPYGTLPHPNVLAGYLIIAMAMVVYSFQFPISKIKKTFYFCAILIGTVALLLTMSRIAISLWLIILAVRLAKGLYEKHRFIIYFLLFIFLMIGAVATLSPLRFRFTNLKIADESITDRAVLINSSIKMIEKNPLFGVGVNNYMVELPYFQKNKNKTFTLQPVHNIYLFIASETGIIGLVIFLWVIKKTYQRVLREKFIIHNSKLIILSAILILGFFDHYFLTLQQGQLLFAFGLGFCWRNSKMLQ